jgi:hypothetical protein
MPSIYRFRWDDNSPPTVVIGGDELDLQNPDGIVWQGHNRKDCRRILLYRTPGITPEAFEKHIAKGNNPYDDKPYYVIKNAKLRWSRMWQYETSVFLVPNDGSRLHSINYIWLGRGPFRVYPVSKFIKKPRDVIHINDITHIDRQSYQICVADASFWVDYYKRGLVYEMSSEPKFVGTYEDIKAHADSGDEYYQRLWGFLNKE